MKKKQANFEAICAIERTLHQLSIGEVCNLLDEHYGMPDLAEELSELTGKIADAIDDAEIRHKAEIYRKTA